MGNRTSSSPEKPIDHSVYVGYYRQLYQELNTQDRAGDAADGKTFRVYIDLSSLELWGMVNNICTCLQTLKFIWSRICGCQFDLWIKRFGRALSGGWRISTDQELWFWSQMLQPYGNIQHQSCNFALCTLHFVLYTLHFARALQKPLFWTR